MSAVHCHMPEPDREPSFATTPEEETSMAYSDSIRVLVLHNDPVASAGLSAAFGKHSDLELVTIDDEPASGRCGYPLPAGRSVDVVVADYENGIKLATTASRRIDGPAKVMIVASADREWEIRTALERGVRGYVLSGCALEELADAVRSIHRGVRHLSSRIAQRLAESVGGEALTAREEDVLRLVAEGFSNKAIAKHLNIAVGTVKSHLKGVFDKLNVDSRTQAISAVERRGLLQDATSPLRRAESSQVFAPPPSQSSQAMHDHSPQR
jgi:two-component system NarL family response regulator